MTALSPQAEQRLRTAWRVYHRVGLHEAVVVVSAFLVYFAIRGAVVGRADEALANAQDIVRFQQWLGIYWEAEMQSWIIGEFWAIKVLNFIYFWGHMPVIIIVAVTLYIWQRRTYSLARNAFLASGAIAVVIYWLHPVAPPRLLPGETFIDTMAVYDRFGYNAQETAAFVNPYAAVPSLHFGWSMLLGAMIGWVGKRPIWIALGILWPVAMFFSVVMTANHFILDAVAGAIVSFAGLAIAFGMERAREPVLDLARRSLGARAGQQPAADSARRDPGL